MSTKDTGGPAFMVAELANIRHEGMTLRDYFAAKALQGMIACADPEGDWSEPLIAAWSYMMADAMLKERARGA
jgi:ribulose-5-phosphate 4-epimerase/fuculose-1-phosphate aldolase